MQRNRIILFFVFIVTAFNNNAQNWVWAKGSTTTAGFGDEGFSVSTDVAGNVLITGGFTSYYIGFGAVTLTNSAAGTTDNVFIAKYDPNGNILWAKSAGGYNGVANSISTDVNGNAYITGYFSGSNIVFGTYTLTNNGMHDIFLVKYDPNGNVLWAKNVGGIKNDDPTAVRTDPSGNVFITGNFYSANITFGAYTLSNLGMENMFTVKYDSSGNVLWAKGGGGTMSDYSQGISTDLNGNSIITGNFTSPNISFGTYTLSNVGSEDIFTVKYDPSGNVMWAKCNGNFSDEEGKSTETDLLGNIYVTGYFRSPTLSFGTFTLNNFVSGSRSVFFTKYDPSGNVLWAKVGGGTYNGIGYSISSYSNSVYLSGYFTSPKIGFGTDTLYPPSGSIDPMFLVQFDLNGNFICGEALSSGGDDQNWVSADKFGNVYITSDFQTNPFIVGSDSLNLTGTENVFIAKFHCASPLGVETTFLNTKLISIYPNPNNGSFKLQLENEIENGELILFNVVGQNVFSQKIKFGENEIRTQGLAEGLYHYSVLENKTQVQKGKIVIE